MANFRSLGTPWHETYLSREEGDTRRHPSRCEHYKKPNKNCGIYGKCHGSAHCPYYAETTSIEREKEEKSLKKATTLSKCEKKDNVRVKNPFKIGDRVCHKDFGPGVVKDLTVGRIQIKFDNGDERLLGLDHCLKNKLIVQECHQEIVKTKKKQ